MEFDRRVQIRVDRLKDGRKETGFGSGYLVAPRLVLTAAHVLDDLDPAAEDAVRVSLPDADDQPFPASLHWQRQDSVLDAALVEIREDCGWQVPQSLGDLLTRPPQRYGLLIGNRPHPVTATGFPRMQKDIENSRRLDEQLTGLIAPGTGVLAGRYEISSTGPTPGAGSVGGSRWSGMSGAAALADDGFGGDLLCGVVRRDRRADGGGTRLTATPAAALLADDTFRRLITEHTGWEPVLEPVEPAALLTPSAVDRNLRSPAALLRADAEAIAFHGRATELTDLKAWCENGPPAIEVRVLTGPGGQGKTRLARRLTDTLGRQGWATGHLAPDLTDAPALDGTPPDFTTLNTALALLLVVDYAETRPRLLRRLLTHLHHSRHRVRVLLLARSDGQWRTGSLQAVPAVRDLLEQAPLTPLAPLMPTSRPAKDRRDAFHQAAHDLARLLPLIPTMPPHDWTLLAAALPPPADLHEHRYDNVLTLQMTALIALLQHGPHPVDSAPGVPPERTLLKHEDRFWEASAKAPGHRLDLPAPTLGAAVAVAALCGASTKDEALHVLTTLPGLPAHQMPSAAAWLASLYPPDGDRYWGSLQPDRIAEYHASHTLTEDTITLPDLLDAAAPGQQAQVVTVLARAAIAHYNADRTPDSENVLNTLDMALDAAPLSHQALETATNALPESRITSRLALRLTAALVHVCQQRAADNPGAYADLAGWLSNLGTRLAAMGRLREALIADQQAVEIHRRFAASNPAAYEPSFARSLLNRGIRLGRMGRQEEAVAAVEQALEIFQQLAAENPATHEPELAASLSILGARLAAVGRPEEALTADQRSVEILRRLAAGRPAAYETDLADSLYNLSVRWAEAGQQEKAQTAAEQAVEIYRRFAASNPAAHEPRLAQSLSRLGVLLRRRGHRGRQEEAIAAVEQALEIWQRLAAENPAAYESELARSLMHFSNLLWSAGRLREAMAIDQRAVEILQRLAADTPAAYESDLAASLYNKGNRLAEAGDVFGALSATMMSEELFRGLAAKIPSLLPELHAAQHALTLRRAGLLEHYGHLKGAESLRRWLSNPLPPHSHS
ncbi:tetratricopeptide repeat protein [Streptomyces sp. NPDC058375]|uniref:tetratricopeptide repeat protein n=1 Tax=Streptomyces sp. NPDC058375 TaxID=3346467 RepID=UPI0036610470